MDPKLRRLEPRYALLTACLAAAIVYGSLFPFRYRFTTVSLGTLFATARAPLTFSETAANILFYVPLGLAAAAALRGIPGWAKVILIGLGGAMLSTGMEWAQAYTVDRRPDLWDICANTAGAFVGAAVGTLYSWARRAAFWGYMAHRPYILLLLSGWLGYQLLGSRMGIAAGGVSALGLFQRCVIWLAVGLLIEALVGAAHSGAVLALLAAAVVAMQAVFAGMVPSAQVLSGAIAVALWSTIIWRVPGREAILAGLFVVHVVLVALAPFHFLSSPRHFQVIPFVSFLYDTRGDGARSFLEKAFTYGTLVWVLVRAGWTLRRSTVAAVALVVVLRAAQVYVPGRSAEITDALITLAMAGTMKLLGDQAQASGDGTKRYPIPRTVSR